MRKLFICFIFSFSLSAGAQTLLIGTLSYNPPFEIEADAQKNVMGFDVDIMNEICKRLNKHCKYKYMAFSNLFDAIDEGQIQLSIAAITITDSRQQDYIFSLPYLLSSAQFITLADSSIHDLSDLKNKKIGLLESSAYLNKILSNYKNNNQIVEFKKSANEYQELKSKKVDVIVTDSAVAQYWVANNNGVFKLVGKAIPTGNGYGIMANKTSTQLIADINKTILQMELDGSYLQIYNRYF